MFRVKGVIIFFERVALTTPSQDGTVTLEVGTNFIEGGIEFKMVPCCLGNTALCPIVSKLHT